MKNFLESVQITREWIVIPNHQSWLLLNKKKIISLFEEGISSGEIAEIMGLNPPVIWAFRAHWTQGKYSSNKAIPEEADSLKIISALANGKNPENGDSLPANHLLNSPSVIRAMFHALKSMEKNLASSEEHKKKPKKTRQLNDDGINEKQAKNIEKGRPINSHSPWSEEECQKLIQSYLDGYSFKELVSIFGRTAGGLRSRLAKIAGVKFELLEEMSLEDKRSHLIST